MNTQGMTIKERMLAQALQNFSPVEVAYSSAYDGADQKTAYERKPRQRKLKTVSAEKQAMIDRDAGGIA